MYARDGNHRYTSPMQFSDPLAYLLTWTTYGAWLHGDPRGSIERGGSKQWPKLIEPNEALHAYRRAQMKHPPLLLDAPCRNAVQKAIEEHCKVKNWELIGLAVRTNHVHAVVGAGPSPSRILNALKAWATRRLRSESILNGKQPVWTEGGSKRWLWTPDQVANAVRYVDLHQGNPLKNQ
jgi:REP element-mobilizing transposase RayT